MAVVGLLHDVLKNQALPERITRGLMYLATLGEEAFNDLALGEVRRVELEGDALFALHQVYETRDHDQARFEAHQRAIDIQYVFEGRETVRLAPIDDAAPMSGYDNEKDFRLYHVEDYSSICLKQGMVCILYPTDLHAPGLDFLGKAMIKKCVLKVRVEL